jgi:hypothetical protein
MRQNCYPYVNLSITEKWPALVHSYSWSDDLQDALLFILGKRGKSHRMKSREYCGCWRTVTRFLKKKSLTVILCLKEQCASENTEPSYQSKNGFYWNVFQLFWIRHLYNTSISLQYHDVTEQPLEPGFMTAVPRTTFLTL